MENLNQVEFLAREHKNEHFDVRLIKKIVSDIEDGLPRKLVCVKYGVVIGTVNVWMKKFGSADYHQNIKPRRYTDLQKRTIVTAIEEKRMSIKEAQVAYQIRDVKSIKEWIQGFKQEKVELSIVKEPEMAKKTKPVSQSEAQALQKALDEAQMKIKALNTLIDVAEEQLKIDIRKKSGAKQSSK